MNMEEKEAILNRIARATGVSVADIRGRTRAQLPVAVRHFACLELYLEGYTYAEIGEALNRARVSAYHGAMEAQQRLDVQDPIMVRVRGKYQLEKEAEDWT